MCDFMEVSSTLYVTIMPSLMAIDIRAVELFLMFLTYYVTSRVRKSVSCYGWKFLLVSHHLHNIGGHRLCSIKDIKDLIP